MVLNEKPDARGSLMRMAVVACLSLAVAACTTASADRPIAVTMPQTVAFTPEPVSVEPVSEPAPEVQTAKSEYESMYGAVNDRGNLIPALDLNKIADRNLRREVDYATTEPVGTIVVDPMRAISISCSRAARRSVIPWALVALVLLSRVMPSLLTSRSGRAGRPRPI